MSETGTKGAGSSLAGLAQMLADQKLPPVETWHPPYCGEIDMRIARDGTWHYLGTPIGRPAMVKLFSSVLRREPDGSFVLVTPVERVGIKVDDAPFLAVEAMSDGTGRARQLGFRLNTDDPVIVDAHHALRVTINPASQEPRPYVHVRAGLEALIARSVFYELIDWALAEQQAGAPLGLWSNGCFFPLDGSSA